MTDENDRRARWRRMTKAQLIDELTEIDRLAAGGREKAGEDGSQWLGMGANAFRTFCEHTPSEMAVKDLEGRYVWANPWRLRWLGWGEKDLIGKTAHEVFPKHLADVFVDRDRTVRETGATVEREDVMTFDDGPHFISVYKFPIRDSRGRIVAVGMIGTDITDRKKMEAALRQSEERFRDFALSAADWFWETGPDLRFTYVSEHFFQTLPLSRDDVLGKTWEELASADPEDPGWRQHLDKVRHMQSYRNFEFSLALPDGTVRHVRKSGKSFFDEGGKFLGYRGASSDVTATVEAMRQAAASAARLIEAIEHVPTGIALFDAQDRLVLCNREYGEHWPALSSKLVPGVTFESIMRNWVDLGAFHPSMGRPEDWLAKRLRHHRDAPSRHEQQLADGRWLVVRDEPTREGGVLVFSVNATERKQVAERYRILLSEMAHARRVSMLGELTTSIAHELSQPLAALSTYLSGCSRQIKSKETELGAVKETLDKALEQTELMKTYVSRIKDFARKRKSNREAIDVNHAVREALGLLQDEARRHGVTLRTRLARRLPQVLADRIQVQQVVLNLVRNGIEAVRHRAPHLRRVEVRTSARTRKELAVEVVDGGPGIEPEVAARLFEAFVTTKPEGLGMGLAICRWIVEDHGGCISAASQRPNGTSFRFSLPATGRLR